MDEILASALLALHLGEPPEAIERISPRDAAVRVKEGALSSDTYVIDCGMVLDPQRNLFDHHQDRDLPSAALIIFDRYFSHLAGTELHEIVQLISRVDTRGPKSLDDFDLIGESRKYWSFGQKIFLRHFENDPATILKIFIEGLEDKIAFELARREADRWLDMPGHVEVREVAGVGVLKYNRRPPEELTSALRSADGRLVDDHGLKVIYSFDDRDPAARCLFRTNHGYGDVDFTRSAPEKTLFCHQGGFLLRFAPRDEAEWETVLEQSIG